jgi:hypothetical protein
MATKTPLKQPHKGARIIVDALLFVAMIQERTRSVTSVQRVTMLEAFILWESVLGKRRPTKEPTLRMGTGY